MALTYAVIGGVDLDPAFLNRIKGALAAQAIIVNAEAVNVANHTVRLALMARTIANATQYAVEFAPYIASVNPVNNLANVGIASDADILASLQAVYDAFALRGI